MKKKLNRLWRQMTADKKKFGLMVFVMAIGLLLWGRLILIEKVPRIATADPNTGEQATTDGGESADVSPLLEPLPVVEADLSERLRLDLFAFRHNRYKPLPREDIQGSGVQPRESDVDVEVRRRELEEMVKDLRLQSVIQGPWPLTVINGKVLRDGDTIDGFEVTWIGRRSVKVTREGQSFTLTTQE